MVPNLHLILIFLEIVMKCSRTIFKQPRPFQALLLAYAMKGSARKSHEKPQILYCRNIHYASTYTIHYTLCNIHYVSTPQSTSTGYFAVEVEIGAQFSQTTFVAFSYLNAVVTRSPALMLISSNHIGVHTLLLILYWNVPFKGLQH